MTTFVGTPETSGVHKGTDPEHAHAVDATTTPAVTSSDATETGRMGDRTSANTGRRPGSTRRGQGEPALSPVRVRARLHAEKAVALRAKGRTYEEIAAAPDGKGGRLFSSRKRAHEAVRAQVNRGALLSADRLLGVVSPSLVDTVDPDMLERLRVDLLALHEHMTTADGVTEEQRGVVAGALRVAVDLAERV